MVVSLTSTTPALLSHLTNTTTTCVQINGATKSRHRVTGLDINAWLLAGATKNFIHATKFRTLVARLGNCNFCESCRLTWLSIYACIKKLIWGPDKTCDYSHKKEKGKLNQKRLLVFKSLPTYYIYPETKILVMVSPPPIIKIQFSGCAVIQDLWFFNLI